MAPETSSVECAAALVLEGRLQASDTDKDVKDFLRSVPEDIGQTALLEFADMAQNGGLSEIKSRSGYLLGMLRQRMRKQRRQRRRDNDEDTSAARAPRDLSRKRQKPLPAEPPNVALLGVEHTLFVNQIPYAATKDDVAGHFAAFAGCTATELLPSVRMVVKDDRFTGTAFVDMPSSGAHEAGLLLHGSVFRCASGAARAINVRAALTRQQAAALPGAATAATAEDLPSTNSKIDGGSGSHQRFNAGEDEDEEEDDDNDEEDEDEDEDEEDEDEDEEEEDDDEEERGDNEGDVPREAPLDAAALDALGVERLGLDERALSFLRAVPASVATIALDEFRALDVSKVANVSSFFMGLLRQRQLGQSNQSFGRRVRGGKGGKGQHGGKGKGGGGKGGKGGKGKGKGKGGKGKGGKGKGGKGKGQ